MAVCIFLVAEGSALCFLLRCFSLSWLFVLLCPAMSCNLLENTARIEPRAKLRDSAWRQRPQQVLGHAGSAASTGFCHVYVHIGPVPGTALSLHQVGASGVLRTAKESVEQAGMQQSLLQQHSE